MDLTKIVVLALTLLAVACLVYVELKARQNTRALKDAAASGDSQQDNTRSRS